MATMAMSVKDVVRETTLSRGTVYRLLKSGQLPSVRVGKRRLLVSREALEGILNSTRPVQTGEGNTNDN